MTFIKVFQTAKTSVEAKSPKLTPSLPNNNIQVLFELTLVSGAHLSCTVLRKPWASAFFPRGGQKDFSKGAKGG